MADPGFSRGQPQRDSANLHENERKWTLAPLGSATANADNGAIWPVPLQFSVETLYCSFINQSLPFLGRDHLTAKTYSAIKWSHEHYHNDMNWYLKADDDTYVIVENLKAMLSKYDPRQPYYLGFRALVNLKFIFSFNFPTILFYSRFRGNEFVSFL